MKKTILLQNIEVAFAESEELLLNANLIKITKRTSASKKPVSFIDSKFGLWLLSEERLISSYYNFEKISELHQNIYETYSRIYHCVNKTTDSTENIAKSYAQLEDLIEMYHIDLKTKEKEIKKTSETNNQAVRELNIILEENIDRLETESPEIRESLKNKRINTKTKSKVEETFESLEREKSSRSISDDYYAVQEKLKNESTKQFSIKRELIEQEIKQVSERQKLFTKAVEQLTHHYQLLQQDAKFSTSNYDNQVAKNTEHQKNKQQALEDVEQKRIATQNELEQLELVNIEIEENNSKELELEKEKITELEQQQEILTDDIKKKLKQQDRKKQRLDKLKSQITQAEQELEGLIKDENALIEKQKTVHKTKSTIRDEIKKLLDKQQQQRVKNSLIEESKHQELKQQKKKFYSLQQAVVHLEHEQQNLIQGKQESEKSQQKELEDLQKQRKIKQDMLDILDLELHQKEFELQKLTQQNIQVPADSASTEPELVA